MDRNREGRRNTMAANGLSRRRHRTHTFRDSPEEDGPVELPEPTRLRDRGTGKKDRDRERDRDRDRDRERERDRSSRTKRRRGDRLMHSNNREDGGEDSSEESVNDDEEDEDDDVGGGSVRMLPLNPSSLSSSSLSNHRKSFPPAKDFRAVSTWKAADEMIGVLVPRRARSASTKRLHECWASNGGIAGEQFHRQASTSPVRTSVTTTGMGPSPSPASPSSSNASVRKKIKPSGPKHRPPKSASKPSSAQDEIEIEIAEVLYDMLRRPQGISKQEPSANDLLKFDSRDTSKSSGDGKSRVSSPISNSQSAPPLSSSISQSITPLSAVAPKRKRPRPAKDEGENPTNIAVRNGPIASTSKAESDQTSKVETCSPNFDKTVGSASEKGGFSCSLPSSQVVPPPSKPQPESIKLESNMSLDSKPVTEESERPDAGFSKEEPRSPKKESIVPKSGDDSEDLKASKAKPIIAESVSQREGKIPIDLMAPPPPLRSSPERDVEIDLAAGDPQPLAVESEMEAKPMVKEDEKSQKMSKDEAVAVGTDKKRAAADDTNSLKPADIQKERCSDLRIDLEKTDKDSASGNMVGKRHQQNAQRQPQQPNSEKAVQASSMPLPISFPSWSGGLPPMGYMTPLQGVVSTAVSSPAIPPPHLLFNQPRPKRCATHCYIAHTISYHQRIARMSPLWAAAAGSSSLYGAKACNLSMVPSTELQGNIVSRTANSAQDKGHSPAIFPGHLGKEKGSQDANIENAQRKQILLQQAMPPGAPSNILQCPFIFPLNQQQAAAAAAAASVRPGSVKSLPATGTGVSSSSTSSAVSANASATVPAAAPTMSFSYPNMPGNETQYLAIVQNNAYPFPIPAHVGGPPAYRGTHAQAMPFFNGSFYSSQMLHPSQLQQHQLPAQSQQNQHGLQNTNMSGGSSSSQKHLQRQQQKPNASGTSGGGSLQGFPASSKTQPSQSLQLQQQQQQRQHLPNHHASHPSRQVESELGGEDSPSTADSRLSRAPMNIYGHNFAMPMQPPNFAVMTPASIGGAGAATGANGSHSEKKQQQHTSTKAGVEASQAFAISFAPVNGAATATGLDLSPIAQNHPIMQTQNFQMMAAQAAQHKKNYRVSEEGKTGGDSCNPDEDRKAMAGKAPANVGQSIVFSGSEVSDPSISAIAGNTVIDSSARTLNPGSAASRALASGMPTTFNSSTVSSQQQMQRNQQQQQPIQIPKHQLTTAASRNKTPSTSNGNVYADHLSSASSVATKFTTAYPQNLAQSSTTAAQSPRWKNSVRPITSQSPPSMSPTPSAKTVPQQQARPQQAHAQISFATNIKSSATTQGQSSGSTPSPSPPIMAGSPTTSSISKSGGSPRTASTSAGNKVGQASLSTQQPKSSQAVPSRKSSPVGGSNVPSILSGSQLIPSSGTGAKPQLLQQQQQQTSKQALHPAQLFFSNAYMNPQASQSGSSTSTTSAASGYYLQRRGPDSHMQRQSSSGTSSNGMLSFCPSVTIVNASSTDSSKVAAAAASNLKGGGFMHPAHFAAAQQSGNHHQFVAGFPYAVPAAVQVKPAEQKQPAGE
ncbi:protein TIME FOR COFFEE-like isoform X2 [Prosopis cineraria]|uniref:protein TIME FOR COFFEE-like isoform X2 n=1 Tax=Prosopis cineraria TaxID=364024 RepID=UPI00240F3A62|nr:protein TIME FOR COFFEE-like isoform X2 [Prosopis cineraria]